MAEAAVLAGLLKAPSKYSPGLEPGLARERARRSVLAKMVEAGFVSPIDGALNSIADVRFAEPQVMRGETGVEYAVDAVLDRLPGLIAGNDREIVVETTIDGDLQRRAQQMVHDLIDGRRPQAMDASQAALVLLDIDGGITVLVGGRSYGESQFNRALRARRQPGSAFKPFVYLVALESGLTPESIVQDAPILGKGWSPSNDDGRFRGQVTLREGLAKLDQHGRRAPAHEQRRAQDRGSRQAARHPLGAAPRCVAGARHVRSHAAGARPAPTARSPAAASSSSRISSGACAPARAACSTSGPERRPRSWWP